jgi:hypothetical protein
MRQGAMARDLDGSLLPITVIAGWQRLIRVSLFASVWTLGYAAYRLYYGLGGKFGILGTPVSWDEWRRINVVAGVLLLITAMVPLISLRWWRQRYPRMILDGIAWVVAVGCISHALIGIVQRVSSLAGHLAIAYPFWLSIDKRKADLQALFFNEPWFLIEGAVWVILVWVGGLGVSRHRAKWIATAIAAITLMTTVGLLSAFGLIGRWIAG